MSYFKINFYPVKWFEPFDVICWLLGRWGGRVHKDYLHVSITIFDGITDFTYDINLGGVWTNNIELGVPASSYQFDTDITSTLIAVRRIEKSLDAKDKLTVKGLWQAFLGNKDYWTCAGWVAHVVYGSTYHRSMSTGKLYTLVNLERKYYDDDEVPTP